MTDIEKAYIAGFFDGEGCLSITKCGNKGDKNNVRACARLTLYLSICNTNISVLNYIKDVVGFGKIRLVKRSIRRGETPAYVWYCRGFRIVPFLKEIKDYSIVKKEQLLVALLFAKTRQTRSSDNYRMSYDTLNYRWELKKRINELNTGGHKATTIVERPDLESLIRSN